MYYLKIEHLIIDEKFCTQTVHEIRIFFLNELKMQLEKK